MAADYIFLDVDSYAWQFDILATKINDTRAWAGDPLDFTTKFNNPAIHLDARGIGMIMYFMRLKKWELEDYH